MRRVLMPVLALLVAAAAGPAAEKIVEPVLKRRVPPEYSAELKRRWPANLSEGAVVIDLVVDARGNVADTHVARARIQELIPPALAAVKKWKFKAATADGRAAPAVVQAEIWFHVSGKLDSPQKEAPPPVFVALGDKLPVSPAAPDPAEFYTTTEALPHLEKVQPQLPADLRAGDPAGRTLIEPCPILMPLPQIKRAILDAVGGWVKYRVASFVRADGSLGKQFILSSTAPETNAAMASAMTRWRFIPGTVNGKAAAFLVVTDYEVGEVLTVEFGKDTPVK